MLSRQWQKEEEEEEEEEVMVVKERQKEENRNLSKVKQWTSDWNWIHSD